MTGGRSIGRLARRPAGQAFITPGLPASTTNEALSTAGGAGPGHVLDDDVVAPPGGGGDMAADVAPLAVGELQGTGSPRGGRRGSGPRGSRCRRC